MNKPTVIIGKKYLGKTKMKGKKQKAKTQEPKTYAAVMRLIFKLEPAFKRKDGIPINGVKIQGFAGFTSEEELKQYIKYYCLKYGIDTADAIDMNQELTEEDKILFKNVEMYQDKFRDTPKQTTHISTEKI